MRTACSKLDLPTMLEAVSHRARKQACLANGEPLLQAFVGSTFNVAFAVFTSVHQTSARLTAGSQLGSLAFATSLADPSWVDLQNIV